MNDAPAHAQFLTLPFSAGPEILEYLKSVSEKYKLDKFLRYGHCLTSASWDEKSSQWTLQFDLVDDQGVKVGQKTEVADIVIQGMGGLSRWDWPSIPGLKDFKVRSALRCRPSSLLNSE